MDLRHVISTIKRCGVWSCSVSCSSCMLLICLMHGVHRGVSVRHVAIHGVHVTRDHLRHGSRRRRCCWGSGGGVWSHAGQRSRQRILLFFHESLGFASGSILVVGMFLHMDRSEPLGLIDERPLLRFRQEFPLCPESFRDFWVVHFWIFLSHFSPLTPGPDHKSIHGPLDSILIFLLVQRTRASPSWWRADMRWVGMMRMGWGAPVIWWWWTWAGVVSYWYSMTIVIRVEHVD